MLPVWSEDKSMNGNYKVPRTKQEIMKAMTSGYRPSMLCIEDPLLPGELISPGWEHSAGFSVPADLSGTL